MLISLNWIKDFVDVPALPPSEIGRLLTLATAEVEGVKAPGNHLKNIRVVETLETKPHPNAEKLRLVTFRNSEGQTAEVVCGAPNVRPGLKVAYAPIGTKMPNGLVLEAKKIRDVMSHGMLCSKAELGVGDDHDGIWELPSDTPLGRTLGEILGTSEDTIIEIDNKSLTHRPDLWGHYGMAREFATVFKTSLKNPFDANWEKEITKHFTSDKSPISISVDEDSSCLGYFGLSIDGITVSESPDWIKERLTSAGLRPINNMVDIGNYVMLELGMPLHIFDRNKIQGGKLNVSRLKEDSKLKVLTGETVNLRAGDTIISDSSGPVVIAGIIGGESSGVSNETKNIFIETANWRAGELRKLSTRLGIRTDSSQRFEKSLDSALLKRTILRAAGLVLKLYPNAKVIGGLQYAGPEIAPKKITIETSAERISKKLGHEVSKERINEILSSLDFKIASQGNGITVEAPSYRATKDIECEADIVEEIGRIIGYDNIKPTSPLGDIAPIRLSPQLQLHRKVQDFFVLRGQCLEIQTYPMVGAEMLKRAKWPEMNESLKIANALTQEADRMRPSVIPSLLEAVALNQKQYEKFQMFEIGRSYLVDQKNFSSERTWVSFVMFDRAASPFMSGLNLMEELITYCNLPAQIIEPDSKQKNSALPSEWHGAHPIEHQALRVMGKSAGAVFTIHPAVLASYKVRGNGVIGLIDITDVANAAAQKGTKYTPISRFPTSSFDATVVAGERVPAGAVLDAVKKLKRKEIQDVKLVTIFNLPDASKAVSIRCTFGDTEATLTAEKIKELEQVVLVALEKAGYPLRK
jgi:phenylalanyl-tRNA synthetase beta chain